MQCLDNTPPERGYSLGISRPPDVGRRLQHGHHGARHVSRGHVIQAHDDQSVVIVHDVAHAQRQLELTPLAAHEAVREDHHDLLAALHALHDVVHDVVARGEVPLVDAQPQPQPPLQLRKEVLTDERQVIAGVRHEDVVIETFRLKTASPQVAVSSEGFVQQQAEVPPEAEERGGQGHGQDEDGDDDDDESVNLMVQQTGLAGHEELLHRQVREVLAAVVVPGRRELGSVAHQPVPEPQKVAGAQELVSAQVQLDQTSSGVWTERFLRDGIQPVPA